MVTLYLRDNKHLCVLGYNSNYKGEDRFETVKIISSGIISNHNIQDCNIECHIINPNNDGDIIQLSFEPEEDRFIALFSLKSKYTALEGKLSIFLKILDTKDNSIGYTNMVNIIISPNPTIETYISKSNLTLLEQYSEIFAKAKEITDKDLNEEKIQQYINEYFETHDIIEEITKEEIESLF